jgi:hypothetical protein
MGGYGSQTGDQMLDPKNYYDLYRFDVRTASFKKIYDLKPLSTPFTFANSLVIGAHPNEFYGLIFPNDRYNSSLQLIEGSLSDSNYRLLGDPIPYSFHDVQSFADLYYSSLSNKLIAVTLLYSKEELREKNTEVRIYTLNFPPEAADAVVTVPVRTGWLFRLFWILAGIAILAGIFLFRRRRRIQPQGANGPTATLTREEQTIAVPVFSAAGTYGQEPIERSHRPAIYLFGQFQVFDKEGNDITRLFTPLLKELFLIVATYTFRNGRGISSEGLNEILWHDKAEKDAKNNRSVNLAKLKTILEKVGNCSIHKESAYWQFQVPDEEIFVDYKEYMLLVQGASAEPGRNYIQPLVDIIKRGAFLTQTEYNWLDNIKSEISNSTIDLCMAYIKGHDNSKDLEFIIEITNCIFYFDSLNEDALIHKCKSLILLKRHTLANNTYLKFLKEYKDIYGTDFGKSFQDVIS